MNHSKSSRIFIYLSKSWWQILQIFENLWRSLRIFSWKSWRSWWIIVSLGHPAWGSEFTSSPVQGQQRQAGPNPDSSLSVILLCFCTMLSTVTKGCGSLNQEPFGVPNWVQLQTFENVMWHSRRLWNKVTWLWNKRLCFHCGGTTLRFCLASALFGPGVEARQRYMKTRAGPWQHQIFGWRSGLSWDSHFSPHNAGA